MTAVFLHVFQWDTSKYRRFFKLFTGTAVQNFYKLSFYEMAYYYCFQYLLNVQASKHSPALHLLGHRHPASEAKEGQTCHYGGEN